MSTVGHPLPQASSPLGRALKCIGATAAILAFLLLTPFEATLTVITGFANMLVWKPAVVLIAIGACVMCMSFNRVFPVAYDQKMKVAGMVLVVGTIVLMVLGGAAGAIGHRTMVFDADRSLVLRKSDMEKSGDQYFQEYTATSNICRKYVQTYLDIDNPRGTFTINGVDSATPDPASCTQLLNTMRFSLVDDTRVSWR